MLPAELFRLVVTVQYGPQWDNYPIDFNISKNRISLIMHFREKRYRRKKKSCNQKIPQKNMFPIKKKGGGGSIK